MINNKVLFANARFCPIVGNNMPFIGMVFKYFSFINVATFGCGAPTRMKSFVSRKVFFSIN